MKTSKNAEQRSLDKALDLLTQMRENAAEEGWLVWKNIPLAKEYYKVISQDLPIRSDLITPKDIMAFADAIALESLLDQRDSPRLCLQFLALRKKARAQAQPSDEDYDKRYVMEVEEADNLTAKLEAYIDLSVPMETWLERFGGHLRFDPVERTEQWEDCAYEVEKECDRRLSGEPRGMGFCFGYWHTKAAVLRKYGIDWKSPSVMNPRVMFD